MYALPAQLPGRPEQTEGHMPEQRSVNGQPGSPAYVGRTLYFGKRRIGGSLFAGCSLHCVFCQNFQISNGQMGQEITKEHLTELFYRLQEQGANNINLVTPDHYLPQIVWAVQKVKKDGFTLPFIYNCSGYETLESLRKLEGLIDVYLPDFKYIQPETAQRYSHAADYPNVVKTAIAEWCDRPVHVYLMHRARYRRVLLSDICSCPERSEKQSRSCNICMKHMETGFISA